MKILLSHGQWNDLLVDENHELVRCAFYLGYSMISIRQLVRTPKDARERGSIIATAHTLGINDQDKIVKSQAFNDYR